MTNVLKLEKPKNKKLYLLTMFYSPENTWGEKVTIAIFYSKEDAVLYSENNLKLPPNKDAGFIIEEIMLNPDFNLFEKNEIFNKWEHHLFNSA